MALNARDYITQDRRFIYDKGAELAAQEQQRREAAMGQKNAYQSWGIELNAPLTEGRGGYNQQEQQDIAREEDLQNLLPSDADYESNYFTSEERAGIAGDPASRGRYFDPNTAIQEQSDSAGRQRSAASGLRSGMYNSIDEPDLRLSEDYAPGVESTLASSEDRVRDAGPVIDQDRLRQDPGYAARVRMTPGQQQDIVTGAGISAGTGYRAAAGDLTRQARAAGVDPLGESAMKERLLRQGAGEAGDAMTKARIYASDAAAGREQDIESGRRAGEVSAAQSAVQVGGLQSGNELALSGQRLTAQERTEAMRQQGVRDIGDRRMQAAQVAGQADIAGEQALNAQGRQVGQFNTTTGTALATGQEQDAAARAAAIAQNRQATGMANQGNMYNRGAAVNTELSNRRQAIANQRLKEQAEGRAYVTHQGDQATQTEDAAAARQGSLYATQGGLAQGATQQQAVQDNQPKWWEKVGALAVGGASAYFGGKK